MITALEAREDQVVARAGEARVVVGEDHAAVMREYEGRSFPSNRPRQTVPFADIRPLDRSPHWFNDAPPCRRASDVKPGFPIAPGFAPPAGTNRRWAEPRPPQ
jgi:hypothetical protein